MERRLLAFAAFFLAWLVVLIVPETRHVLRQQLRGYDEFGLRDEALNPPLLTPLIRRVLPQPASFVELAKRYPNHIGVQLRAAEEKRSSSAQKAALASGAFVSSHSSEAYDETIQKFPDETWLLASRLRVTFGKKGFFRRSGGELDATRQTLPNGQVRFRFYKEEPSSATPAEIEAAIAVARRGQKLEPENYYFDMMLAVVLFAAERDDEALRVLAAARGKTRYDDHMLEDGTARIAALELQQPLTLEEKLGESESGPFAYYAPFRQFARFLTWKGIQRTRAGDHAGALQILGDLSTIGARMREGSTSYAGAFGSVWLGKDIQRSAWRSGRDLTAEERKILQPKPNQIESKRADALRAQLFANYARAHGRPDLARQALLDNEKNQALPTIDSVIQSEKLVGLPIQTFDRISLLLWLTALLLAQLQWMFLACVAATLLLWLARRVRRSREAVSREVRGLDVAGAAAWIAGIVAVVLIAVSSTYDGPFDGLGQDPSVEFLTPLLTVSPLLLGAVYCLLATAWRGFRARRAGGASTREGELQSATVVAPSEKTSFRQRDIGGVVLFTINATLPVVVVLAWFSSAVVGATTQGDMVDEWGDSQTAPFLSGDYTTALAVTLIAVFWWMVRPDRKASQTSSRESMIYAVRWYRQTLLATAVLASVAYAALAISSLPVRAQATKAVDKYVQRGDVAVMKEASAPASTRAPQNIDFR